MKGYLPQDYLQIIVEQEKVCYINSDMQKKDTSFPIFFPDSKDPEIVWDSLMDTGATRSCMNYNMYFETRKQQPKTTWYTYGYCSRWGKI